EACCGVGEKVEGRMKSQIERPSYFNQFRRVLLIDVAVTGQTADDDSICFELFCDSNIFPHDLKLCLVVQKVSPARPDHHLQADLKSMSRHLNTSRARSCPAFQQIITKPDAVRAAPFCSKCARCRIDTNLNAHSARG